MIDIRFHRSRSGRIHGFIVTGHAESAPRGKDIVCAGVSALAQTAPNALETVARVRPIVCAEDDGYLSVELPNGMTRRQRRDADIVLRTVEQGIRDIAATYAQHITIHYYFKKEGQ
ncbi:MAG: ribosomal-processing cysteine protease Prp [Clostridia bacterium]|nr:ribosomal-processing cysteine protease Prp [Clostridia bacterium]